MNMLQFHTSESLAAIRYSILLSAPEFEVHILRPRQNHTSDQARTRAELMHLWNIVSLQVETVRKNECGKSLLHKQSNTSQ